MLGVETCALIIHVDFVTKVLDGEPRGAGGNSVVQYNTYEGCAEDVCMIE